MGSTPSRALGALMREQHNRFDQRSALQRSEVRSRAYKRHSPGTPFSSCSPRSTNSKLAPEAIGDSRVGMKRKRAARSRSFESCRSARRERRSRICAESTDVRRLVLHLVGQVRRHGRLGGEVPEGSDELAEAATAFELRAYPHTMGTCPQLDGPPGIGSAVRPTRCSPAQQQREAGPVLGFRHRRRGDPQSDLQT